MPSARVILIFVTVSSFLLQPVSGEKRKLYLRGQLGYMLGLDDVSPHARLGGATITGPAGSHVRGGVEVLHADMYGNYQIYKTQALLVTPVIEYEFSPHRRISPYLVVGVGFTLYRARLPNPRHHFDPTLPEFEWDHQGNINFTGGLGVRLFLGKSFFVAPEVRIGLVPMFRSTVGVDYVF